MRHLSIRVVCVPNQVNPWNICLIVKLVQVLDEQSVILAYKIDNS
jgi:hypothetical protein